MADGMRALIIGYGSIGQRHARNLRTLLPEAEILVLKRKPGAIENARVFTELADAISAQPALAIVATPSAAHIDVLVDLVDAGVATYVEKPVVTCVDDVAAVRAALKRRPGIPHATGFNLRLLPSLQAAKTLVLSGELGQIARASFSSGQWLPDWRRIDDFRQSYSTRKAEGGGVIFDLSHELDAGRFLLGEIAIEGCVTSRLPSLGIDAESAASIIGRSESGSLISVNIDYVARRPIRRYELVGDEATLVWDLAQRRLERHAPGGVDVVSDRIEDFDVSGTYIQGLRSFAAAAAGREAASLQSLEDGLRSTELAIKANMLDIRS